MNVSLLRFNNHAAIVILKTEIDWGNPLHSNIMLTLWDDTLQMVGMVHECSTGKLLAGTAFLHHDAICGP